MKCTILLDGRFCDPAKFEHSYSQSPDPFHDNVSEVHIIIGERASFLINAILRLLCLCNQLARLGKQVTLEFKYTGKNSAYSYFNRCGFFEQLNPDLVVAPCRPEQSLAELLRGQSESLMEIKTIRPSNNERAYNRMIPHEVTALVRAQLQGSFSSLVDDLQTILSETCGNIPEHSSSTEVGYVLLQRYNKSGTIFVAISDNGVGLLNSLREGMRARGSNDYRLNDDELILKVIREGLSRLDDPGRGTGLPRVAELSIKYNVTMHLRLENLDAELVPDGNEYSAIASFNKPLNTLKGTHISLVMNENVITS